jgi:hypothetical protein
LQSDGIRGLEKAMKRTFVLAHETARRRCQEAVWDSPDGYMVQISEPTKRRIQEEKYHAMMGDISKQCSYNGRKLDVESWKRLLVESVVFILREEARGQGKPDPFPRGGAVLPSLDGLRIVQVEVLTRNFTVSQAAQFIEYLYAFGADSDVLWTEPKERSAA